MAFQNGSSTGRLETIEARTGVLSGAVDRYLANNDTAKARRINWLNELIEMEILSPCIFFLGFLLSLIDFFFLCLKMYAICKRTCFFFFFIRMEGKK